MTREEYEALKQVDIRTVDPSTLVDIRNVKADASLPEEERMLDIMRQMNGNPFIYRCGKMVVKVSYSGKRSFQEAFEDCLRKA